MKNDIKNYLYTLQSIEQCKADMCELGTPYAFETRRSELHEKIFSKHIFPFLKDGTDYNFAYQRSKELFGRLDRIWNIYNLDKFDINNDEQIIQLAKDLCKFFSTTETKFYLEGRTAHIHGLNI